MGMTKESIFIKRITPQGIIQKEDEVAVEQTIEIKLKNGKRVVMTCTPTYVEELVLGKRFLLGDLEDETGIPMGGTVSMEAVLDQDCAHGECLQTVDLQEIFRIANESFDHPGPLFMETGCAHSCALICHGEVVFCVEDIGRHNALDKVIGYTIKHQIPREVSYIFTSGRISGDYLQKAADAGFPMVISRAAVTEHAVILAKKADITMLGFVRKNTGNIYHEGKVNINE